MNNKEFESNLQKAFSDFKFDDFHISIFKFGRKQVAMGYYHKMSKLVKDMYQINYDPKKKKLVYVNGFDHVQCITTDTKWGNTRSALTSLATYSWTVNNDYANKIMNKDPHHYFEMILFSILVKRTIAGTPINLPLSKGTDYDIVNEGR